jgi:serine/threonine protein kinase
MELTMSPSTLEGTTLGKYRLLEALGRGGMAQVYKAYHPLLDRNVAIKILRSDLVEQDEFLLRFRREAHAVSGLRHTNIVQVFDFDVQDDLYYMVMELLEGDTLRAKMNEYRVHGQRMPLVEVVDILTDVLSGLGYAHGEGVIHRDIKPANIMLTKKKQAVLTDFGIAQIVGSTQYTVSGALMGTLNYMAPEQGLKGVCDSRSDIYSLGIVLYEMLTGYIPFDADTPLAILMKHLNDPLPLPTQVDPTLPSALENVVLKALAKDPDDRFQTAQEMAAALQQSLPTDPPSAVRPVVQPPEKSSGQFVFSGMARKQISDHHFADADTDAGLRPMTDASRYPETVSPFHGFVSRLTVRLANLRIFNISPLSGVFGGLASFLLVNMIAMLFSTLGGQSVFPKAWPIEVFLLANLLTLIGWGVQSHWLLVPAGIWIGNAFLLAYSTLTGRWGDWVFLWMFEPLILWFSITVPIAVNKIQGTGPVWARAAAVFFLILSILFSIITIVTAFVIS